MATQSYEQLISGANKIRQNELPESNTAALVGEQLLQMVNKQQEESRERVKGITEYNVSVHHPTSGTDGTNRYTLETAIVQVPPELRNIGLKVSFINSDGKVETWEFQGGIFTNTTDWVKQVNDSDFFALEKSTAEKIEDMNAIIKENKNDTDIKLTENKKIASEANDTAKGLNNKINGNINYEDLSEAARQQIEASGGGSITNLPDDDDLETVVINGVSKIREKTTKEYIPADYTGLGRIILRKNMINGVNTLTQVMMKNTNTIYVIRYDFDLSETSITVPEGCTLYFEGGSLKNGTLNPNGAMIVTSQCSFYNIVLSGIISASCQVQDYWFDNIFKSKLLCYVHHLDLSRNHTVRDSDDFTQGSNAHNEILINGQGHQLDIASKDFISGRTMLSCRICKIYNLTITETNGSQEEKIGTIFNVAWFEMNNCYYIGYCRLASNWSYHFNEEDLLLSQLHITNCQLSTTEFLFESCFNRVRINNSRLYVDPSRSTYSGDIISIGAVATTEAVRNIADVVVRDCIIHGGWEIWGELNSKGIDMYNTIEVFNTVWENFHITSWSYDTVEYTEDLKMNLVVRESLLSFSGPDWVYRFNYHNSIIIENCTLLFNQAITLKVIKDFTLRYCNIVLKSDTLGRLFKIDFAQSVIDAGFKMSFNNCNFTINKAMNPAWGTSIFIPVSLNPSLDTNGQISRIKFNNCSLSCESNVCLGYDKVNIIAINNMYYNPVYDETKILDNGEDCDLYYCKSQKRRYKGRYSAYYKTIFLEGGRNIETVFL